MFGSGAMSRQMPRRFPAPSRRSTAALRRSRRAISMSTEGSGRGQSDTTIRGYRVNAEAAKFSRVVAAEIYGAHRTYGYLYGGSGGAYQTVTSAEMTTGVWDGFVPYVMGSPQSIPNCFTV